MINYNGKLLSGKEAFLTPENRAYNYGDGLFETIRVINGKIMFWEDHYFRLMASMRILRMEIPMSFSPEFLEQEILDLINENNLQDQPVRVKINVHRNPGGLYLPESREISYLIRTTHLESPFYTLSEEKSIVELFKDHYIMSGLLSTIKSTNKIVNVLGSIFAEENDYDNCLLLNEKKSVIEALNGNLFLVKGNTIKTPPLEDGCLNGIIRKKLIEILKNTEEFTLEEVSISPFVLQKADELFITNSIVGIKPITKYRKKEYSANVAKALIGKLNTKARLD
ncbi:aminotransferase class IV [Mesonia aquimarina]|uniref:aminotransferase class IV n=1 Tax=Mesonia aquimarina TaxID=1504967 RepID=UPI000EF5C39B|nr:aminotransferase class IV [Mesonia aquimarina]